jgi:hypothetical protein
LPAAPPLKPSAGYRSQIRNGLNINDAAVRQRRGRGTFYFILFSLPAAAIPVAQATSFAQRVLHSLQQGHIGKTQFSTKSLKSKVGM